MAHLISLNRKAWSGAICLTEQDIPAAAGLSKEVVRLGTKRFVDNSKDGPLGFVKVVYNKAWHVLQDLAIKVGSASYLVADSYLDKVTGLLDDACKEYNKLSDDFCNNYDQHLDDFLNAHPNEANILRGFAPTVATVRKRFGLTYTVIKIDQFVEAGACNDNTEILDNGLHEFLEDIAFKCSKKMWTKNGVKSSSKSTLDKIVEQINARLDFYPDLELVRDFILYWKDHATNEEAVRMMCNVIQLPNVVDFIKNYNADSYILDKDMEYWLGNKSVQVQEETQEPVQEPVQEVIQETVQEVIQEPVQEAEQVWSDAEIISESIPEPAVQEVKQEEEQVAEVIQVEEPEYIKNARELFRSIW